MRLIHCDTLMLKEFFGSNIPSYAILSHTWGDDEVTFADLPGLCLDVEEIRSRSSFHKTSNMCRQALEHGLEYAWVDTLCIDKSSSAELSEAINSMFAWYKLATRCYVYLSDISISENSMDITSSRWFNRGWTLQELIAPSALTFYDKSWKWLGTRHDYAERIYRKTSIDLEVLRYGIRHRPKFASRSKKYVSLRSFCVAQRMSWASGRETTREEDKAYSLLGIFDVNMPLLYGEGKRAFQRLQEEIMRNFADDSIFAWGLNPQIELVLASRTEAIITAGRRSGGFLAGSPTEFQTSGSLNLPKEGMPSFSKTNNGLRIRLPLVPLFLHVTSPDCTSKLPSRNTANLVRSNVPRSWVGILSCSLDTAPGPAQDIEQGPASGPHLIGILLQQEAESEEMFCRRELCFDGLYGHTFVVDSRLAFQAIVREIEICHKPWVWRSLYKRGNPHRCSVNVCHNLQKRTVYCVGGRLLDYDRVYGARITEREAQWDSQKGILSFQSNGKGYVCLVFGARHGLETGFIVIVDDKNSCTSIHEGAEHTLEELEKILSVFADGSEYLNPDNIILTGADGEKFAVRCTVQTNQVYDWYLLEVDLTMEEMSESAADCPDCRLGLSSLG